MENENLLCNTHDMDYQDDCRECNEKEDNFTTMVLKRQQQLECNHEFVDAGDEDTHYYVCIKCEMGYKDQFRYLGN